MARLSARRLAPQNRRTMEQEYNTGTTKKRVMKSRGRPKKKEGDAPALRPITKAIRFSKEELDLINEQAALCKMNFSEYVRKVLIGYKPSVPDPDLKNQLWAARTDIRNFASDISGKMKGWPAEKRKTYLQNDAILHKWEKAIVPLLDFIDSLIKR